MSLMSLCYRVQDDMGSSSDGRLKSCDMTPHSSGMNLVSWNEDNLDEDTQDLFSDSPVKVRCESGLLFDNGFVKHIVFGHVVCFRT